MTFVSHTAFILINTNLAIKVSQLESKKRSDFELFYSHGVDGCQTPLQQSCLVYVYVTLTNANIFSDKAEMQSCEMRFCVIIAE